MKHNVIFIEGLPGSGKTTFAKKLCNALKEKGMNAKVFNEGELHPIDLAWCSVMDLNTYEAFKQKYPQLKSSIEAISKRKGTHMIVPFIKLDRDKANQEVYDDFARYEIYTTNDLLTFKNAHINLWKAFSKEADKDTMYIFECVFLQNHINELILKYNLNLTEKVEYFKDLMDTIQPLNPIVHYVKQSDVDGVLNKIIEQRRSPDPKKYSDWIDLMVKHLKDQPFGKVLGYVGQEGVFSYFKDRQEAEIDILDSLNMPTYVHELEDDYDEVFATMLNATNKLLG